MNRSISCCKESDCMIAQSTQCTHAAGGPSSPSPSTSMLAVVEVPMVQGCESDQSCLSRLLPLFAANWGPVTGPRARLFQALSRPSTKPNTKPLRRTSSCSRSSRRAGWVFPTPGEGAAARALARMFYSVQILAKKGPLGIIWIAATLDKRLKRNQVFEANIDSSVGARASQRSPRWPRVRPPRAVGPAQRSSSICLVFTVARRVQTPSSTQRRRWRCGCRGSCCWAWSRSTPRRSATCTRTATTRLRRSRRRAPPALHARSPSDLRTPPRAPVRPLSQPSGAA